jgi:hypothetical protein
MTVDINSIIRLNTSQSSIFNGSKVVDDFYSMFNNAERNSAARR